MARGSSGKTRIEPRFEDPRAKVRSPAKAASRKGKQAKNTSAKSNRGGKKRAAQKKRSRGARSSPLWMRFLRWLVRPVPRLFYWGSVLALWATIGVSLVVGYYATQLPSADTWAVPDRPPNMRILAADKSVLANRGATGGKALRLEEMSPHIAQAVIAIEDRRFHAHFGFDPIGFTRAMTRNLMKRRLREGGSTITQQLAKNLFLKPERTFGRKVQELILAVWLEANYSKAEILELYLNRVYFGAGATGVDAAARRYFGKSAKHVSVPEAALLAGLLKAPSRYTPARDPDLAQRRARVVLKAMQREGYIKPGTIDINHISPGENARHFRSGPEHFASDMIVRQVRDLIGDVDSDIVVETTLSPYLMTAGHSLINTALQKHGKKKAVSQAALVSMRPDGAVRAIIGGRDYARSQFNRAVDARRQPGSSFKTFVYLAALESGLTSDSVLVDEPVRIGNWRPANYDRRHLGPVSLEVAFQRSLNTIAAKLIRRSGPGNVAAMAKRLGITSPLAANASLALGTSEVNLFELTAAYAPLANGGRAAKPYLVRKITDAEGRILYRRAKPQARTVLMPAVITDMNRMLSAAVVRGTGRSARLKDHPAGGKTGTSQEFRNALFVGHTAHMVTGVWFGNDDNSPTNRLTGGALPASVWRDFMTIAHSGLKPRPLPGGNIQVAEFSDSVPVPTNRPGDRTGSVEKRPDSERKRTILDLILGR